MTNPQPCVTLPDSSIFINLSIPCYLALHDVEEELARAQYLPLAIEHCSAYLRQLGPLNARTYCLEFDKTRQDLPPQLRTGSREAAAIATTCTMAIQTIRRSCKPAVDLLRVLSFLNPNGVMIELLISGRKSLGESLGDFMKDERKMRVALLELEKFGLIKWVQANNIVQLHRVVQKIVRDMMRHNEMMSVFANVVDMFYSVLPNKVTSKTKQIYEKYESQFLEPLGLQSSRSEDFAFLNERVGTYFGSINMFTDCEKLLSEAITILAERSADPDCLRVMKILKAAYQLQGKTEQASKVHARMEKLSMEMQRRREAVGAILGVMNNSIVGDMNLI